MKRPDWLEGFDWWEPLFLLVAVLIMVGLTVYLHSNSENCKQYMGSNIEQYNECVHDAP